MDYITSGHIMPFELGGSYYTLTINGTAGFSEGFVLEDYSDTTQNTSRLIRRPTPLTVVVGGL
jgi:hypothetical protein